MILFQNKFTELVLHEKFIEFTWFEASEEMTDDKFKEIMLDYAEMVEKHKPKRIVADIKRLKFLISPELQKWTDNNVFKRTLEAGLLKDAYVAPENVVAHMSSEQLFDEAHVSQKERKFFEHKEDAIKWLLNDS